MAKTIGTTTLASTGGGMAGFFIAQTVVDIFHLELSDNGLMGLGFLLVAIGSLIGGYLSPSKREELAKVMAEANVPTAQEIAQEVAVVAPTAVVPSAGEVAQAVVAAQSDVSPAVSPTINISAPDGVDPEVVGKRFASSVAVDPDVLVP